MSGVNALIPTRYCMLFYIWRLAAVQCMLTAVEVLLVMRGKGYGDLRLTHKLIFQAQCMLSTEMSRLSWDSVFYLALS